MKTAISLPNPIFEEAEALAQQLKMSPSELYTEALKAYLRRHNRDQVLSKLNEVYSKESSDLDTVMPTTFIQSPIRTALVVILTSNIELANALGNVLLPRAATGLPRDSVANVSQILTVDKAFLKLAYWFITIELARGSG